MKNYINLLKVGAVYVAAVVLCASPMFGFIYLENRQEERMREQNQKQMQTIFQDEHFQRVLMAGVKIHDSNFTYPNQRASNKDNLEGRF